MIRDELSKFEHWQTLLAPRLILGIWHVSRAQSGHIQCAHTLPAQIYQTRTDPSAFPPSLRHLHVRTYRPGILLHPMRRILNVLSNLAFDGGRGISTRVCYARQENYGVDGEQGE